MYDALNVYRLDMEYMLAENWSRRNEGRVNRYNSQKEDINRLIDLDLVHLNALMLKLQDDIMSYY